MIKILIVCLASYLIIFSRVAYAQSVPSSSTYRATLPKEFALTYDVTMKEVQTKRVVKRYRVALSVQGEKILYTAEGSDSLVAVVYNGDYSISYDKSGGKKDSARATLISGIGGLCDTFLPIAAADFSSIKFIKNPKVKSLSNSILTINAESPALTGETIPSGRNISNFPYMPSTVTLTTKNSHPEIKDCILAFSDGSIAQKWEYSDYKNQMGFWIPSKMIFSAYRYKEINGNGSRVLSYVFNYNISKFSLDPMPSKFFDYSGWLRRNDTIVDKRTKDIIGFSFLINPGNLESQIKRARWEQSQTAAKIKSGDVKGSNLSGVLLLAGLACGVSAWIWRKRQSVVG